MHEGEERWLLVASPDEELLTHVARDLQTDQELNVGEMPFSIEEIQALDPDVGEPGSRGTLESGTGVLVRIPPWQREAYGIQGDHGNTATFWRPKHTLEPFRKQVTANLDRKHRLFAPEYLPGPSECDEELFDEYDLLKTYALPVDVTEGERMTYVVSKWKLGYTVRNDDHRRHLNLALDCGIGERNALGFGFLNVADRTQPGETELEGEDAFA
jgi:CRISPR-associated endoribonuclease Cas6